MMNTPAVGKLICPADCQLRKFTLPCAPIGLDELWCMLGQPRINSHGVNQGPLTPTRAVKHSGPVEVDKVVCYLGTP